MADIPDDIIVEDSEEFKGGGTPQGIKDIALQQYSRCCVEGSKEMVSGGLSNKVIRGKQVIVDVPNQREIFINCVKMMEVILIPEIAETKKKHIKDDVETVEKKIEETQKQFEKELDDFARQYKEGRLADANITVIQNKWDLRSVEFYRIKLAVFAKLLKELNYFDEGSAYS